MSCGANATSDSLPLWQDKITQNAHAGSLTADGIALYAAMIRRVSDKGADDAALLLAKRGTELAPESVLLRIILAKLYIKARQCRRALPHLTYADDVIDRQS